MAIKCVVTLLVLCAISSVVLGQVSQGGPHSNQGGPHSNQGGPHSNQGRTRRQVQGGPNEDQGQEQVDQSDITQEPDPESEESGKFITWTSCNFTEVPRLSCHDCNTRLICKPIGGLLKVCRNPFKPHCNQGICSPTPSAGCGEAVVPY